MIDTVSPTTAAGAINGDDITAMRRASYVSAYMTVDGKADIRASKDVTVDGFETQARRVIPVGQSDLVAYDNGGRNRRCYARLTGPQWDTVLGLLRVGDVLNLRWIAGNDCQNLTDANLHADELYLIIVRGERRLTFLVDYHVSPQNTARMIGGGL